MANQRPSWTAAEKAQQSVELNKQNVKFSEQCKNLIALGTLGNSKTASSSTTPKR